MWTITNIWRLAFWAAVNMSWRSLWPHCQDPAYSCDCECYIHIIYLWYMFWSMIPFIFWQFVCIGSRLQDGYTVRSILLDLHETGPDRSGALRHFDSQTLNNRPETGTIMLDIYVYKWGMHFCIIVYFLDLGWSGLCSDFMYT